MNELILGFLLLIFPLICCGIWAFWIVGCGKLKQLPSLWPPFKGLITLIVYWIYFPLAIIFWYKFKEHDLSNIFSAQTISVFFELIISGKSKIVGLGMGFSLAGIISYFIPMIFLRKSWKEYFEDNKS